MEHAFQEGCRQCKARSGWRDPAAEAAERAAEAAERAASTFVRARPAEVAQRRVERQAQAARQAEEEAAERAQVERLAAERAAAEAAAEAVRLAEVAEEARLVEAERQSEGARRESATREAEEEEERRAGPGSARAVAADAWSGLARLARCAGEVRAARREGANSAASVLAQVAGFADLRKELTAGALSPAGGAGTLGGVCAAEEEGVRASRAELEERQRDVRRSAQLAHAKEGPASG